LFDSLIETAQLVAKIIQPILVANLGLLREVIGLLFWLLDPLLKVQPIFFAWREYLASVLLIESKTSNRDWGHPILISQVILTLLRGYLETGHKQI